MSDEKPDSEPNLLDDIVLVKRPKKEHKPKTNFFSKVHLQAQTKQYPENYPEHYPENYPEQYKIGLAPFHDLELIVGEGVFIPRFETESIIPLIPLDYLVENFSEAIDKNEFKVLDIGAGTGAISFKTKSLYPQFQVQAIEKSPQAFKYLKQNRDKLKLNVELILGDFKNLDLLIDKEYHPIDVKYQLILSNPPYIPVGTEIDKSAEFDPKDALFSDTLPQEIIDFSFKHLEDKGVLILEHFETKQDELKIYGEELGFSKVETFNDLNLRPRFLRFTK